MENNLSFAKKINSLAELLEFYKPNSEELELINYSGTSTVLLKCKYFAIAQIIAKVFNQSHQINWVSGIPFSSEEYEDLWVPIFINETQTLGSLERGPHEEMDKAAILIGFISEELSDHALETFPEVYIQLTTF